MKKVILMSIRSEWLVKILNGEKTIEIRKTMPKCELPIDVYLYCTKGKPYLMSIFNEWELTKYKTDMSKSKNVFNGNSKVVAKFTLKWCDKRSIAGLTHSLSDFNTFLKRAGIDWYKNSKEFHDYVSEKEYIYAWRIYNLVVFDKPMELREFKVVNPDVENVGSFGWAFSEDELPQYEPVKKAPQSWQYAYKGEN